jgi:peptide-methionine (R)-S-oxide reductase
MSGHTPWARILHKKEPRVRTVVKSDAEWRATLPPLTYQVLRHKATEHPGTSEYEYSTTPGTFLCAGCGAVLFDSETKFDSGCGWPSFYAPHDDIGVEEHSDYSMIIPRTEVVCGSCGGHLGHVFNDGPPPTHLRYCINGAAITLAPTSGSAAS